jgi:hypothetical protein
VDLPGLLLVALVFAGLAALQVTPEADAVGHWRPLLAYRVDEGLPVSFHVPPGTEEIKLIALAEPLADASEGPLARLH